MDICPNCYGMKEWQGQDCPMCLGKGLIEQPVAAKGRVNWELLGVWVLGLSFWIVIGVLFL